MCDLFNYVVAVVGSLMNGALHRVVKEVVAMRLNYCSGIYPKIGGKPRKTSVTVPGLQNEDLTLRG